MSGTGAPGLPRAYPPDISWSDPFEITPVWALLDRSVARFGPRPCLDFLNRKYTYAEIGRLVDLAAAGLQALGLRKGDRVGLFLPNCPYAVIMMFAVLKAGGIAVNFNPLYVEHEVEYQTRDSGTRFMVTLDLAAIYPRAAAMLGRTRLEKIIVCPMRSILPFPLNLAYPLARRRDTAKWAEDERHVPFRRLLEHGDRPAPVACDPARDIALLQYTGGTTGVPKGAMLSHANIVANCQQCLRWDPRRRAGQERVLAVLPFFHVFGMTVTEMVSLLDGDEIILLPRFELAQLLQTIQRKRPTCFPGVPTLYSAIANFKDIGRYDLSSIRTCISGGAPLPVEVKAAFERLTGCTLVEGYGLSEASPVVTTNPLYGVNKPGSIGLPLPGTTIEILALDDPEQVLPRGEKGEVAISGPQIMLGYWNRPDETEKVLSHGRLRTGDVGYVDEDGYVFLVDRIKDIIIAGGYNIYPRNIEEVIYRHPDVAECIVIGVPDPYRGQTVKAFVAPAAGRTLSAADMLAFLDGKLSQIEIPKQFEFRASLPKTQIGKLSKKMLLDEEAAKRPA
jgi:long-chain acyl-CoA synthetase